MTYKLAAIRFRSVGERSARFTDLTLALTAPATAEPSRRTRSSGCATAAASPASCHCCTRSYCPVPHDFMGRSVKRSLTDYIDSGDTSHVVAVWEPAGRSRTLPGEADGVLVTGAVHEWADLRRPAQPEESRDRLSTCSTPSTPSRASWTWPRCRSPTNGAYPAPDRVPGRAQGTGPPLRPAGQLSL